MVFQTLTESHQKHVNSFWSIRFVMNEHDEAFPEYAPYLDHDDINDLFYVIIELGLDELKERLGAHDPNKVVQYSNGDNLLHQLVTYHPHNDDDENRHIKTMPEKIDFLVSKGMNINAQNDEGQTALYVYVTHDTIDLEVDVLIAFSRNGADLNIKDNEGNTALGVLRDRADFADYYHALLVPSKVKSEICRQCMLSKHMSWECMDEIIRKPKYKKPPKGCRYHLELTMMHRGR
jgi:hypothetical protein